ncbi:phosphate ABC transporter substrate-binding protein [Akkermansiaceae bacterium]|nr:phosphate ABC transporter substrate-binding protein [Akkermansiaceae bacterium]
MLLPILYLGLWNNSDRQVYFIRGSDTEVNLALALAERFMERDDEISLAVSGGGSGTGITALISGKTDVANSSREFKLSEKKMAKDRGVNPVPFIFAVDGLALIVNDSNSVKRLRLDQISALYRGEIKNWKNVGGPDAEVTLYGRQSNSGTYVFFQDEVVQANFSPEVRQMNGTAQIVEAVRSDPSAIGYVGVGYVRKADGSLLAGLRVVPIQIGKNPESISPLEPGVISDGTYPLSRPLFQYTDGVPQGLLREFLLFETSELGQQIVEQDGYFKIAPHHRDQNAKNLQID